MPSTPSRTRSEADRQAARGMSARHPVERSCRPPRSSLEDDTTMAHRTRTTTRRHPRAEAGAAVIEFALVLPLLIMLVFGIIEFGRGYNAKIELTGAVRE